jgi:ADP-ribosylglycohydrolase
MSLAVAELLVEGGRWSPRNLADKFVACFHRDPREGYAGSFHHFLCATRTGDDFLANIRPQSDKSGAAMRAGPVGVRATIGTVLDDARTQARLTHDTPDGIAAAQAAAMMTHYFLYDLGPKAQLGHFVERLVPGNWSVPWQGEVKSKGWMSVRAAITAVGRNESFAHLLLDCVRFGGDVDTVATIALAAASCSREYVNDLPAALAEGLENGAYGRDYLVDLDRRLLALAGR